MGFIGCAGVEVRRARAWVNSVLREDASAEQLPIASTGSEYPRRQRAVAAATWLPQATQRLSLSRARHPEGLVSETLTGAEAR
jgi:hypothetical protein